MTRNPFPTAPIPDDRIEDAMHNRPQWLIEYVQRIHEMRRDWLEDFAEQMREAA